MTIITVSGARKNVGKTILASYLISRLAPCSAMKCSVHEGYDQVLIEDLTILSQVGTDTSRFISAGAENVFWLRSDGHSHCRELHQLMSRFKPGDMVIAEGNSITGCLNPQLAIFIAGLDVTDLKPSAHRALQAADLVLFYTKADLDIQIELLRGINDKASVMSLSRSLDDYEKVTEFVKNKLKGDRSDGRAG